MVSAQAQTGATVTISGFVKDIADEPIPGVAVIINNGTKHWAICDSFGWFEIKGVAKGDNTITCSYLGLKTKTVDDSGDPNQVITLEEDSTEIQDIVVTGIFTREKANFTGSASTYSKMDLKAIGNKNLIESLTTIDPTLSVIDNELRGSDPNALPNLEIRGKTSVIGEISSDYENVSNQPLFILDGMEVELSEIMNLNIDRIESVTVLKDASSTAIYGSKSANGVLVVETIKPESGELRVSYSGDFTMQFPILKDYNLMNSSEKLKFELLAGRYTDSTNQDELDALYNSRLQSVLEGVDSYWLSEPVRTVLNHSHSVYVDGGDKSMQYALGLNYGNRDGVMKGSDRDFVGATMNLTYRKNDFIFSNYFSADFVNSAMEPVSFSEFARANPYYKKRNDDGSIPMLMEPVEMAKTTIYNPLYLFNIVNTNTSNEYTIRDQFNLTWRITDELRARGRIGYNKTISQSEAFKSPNHPDFLEASSDMKGQYVSDSSDRTRYNGDVSISYGRLFGEKHLMNVVGGSSFNHTGTDRNGYSIFGFVGDDHSNPQHSSGFQQGDKPTYSKRISRSASFYSNANYSYNSRYLMDLSLRYDGSSIFGASNMFVGTWALGVGWNVQNEKWLKDAEFLELFKLRASVGNPGNQNFDAYISSGIYEYNPEYGNMFGQSAVLTNPANRNLAWQKTLDQNYGIDLAFFDDRLKFSADYYNKNTDPLLVRISMPTSTGVSSTYTNMGGQISQGFSGNLNYTAIKRNDVILSFNMTFRRDKSKLVNIGDKLDFMNDKGSSSELRRYYDNASLDDIWAVPSAGIDPSTGKEIFIKKNGEYTFVYDVDDEQVVGSSSPDIEGMFGVSLYYKSFSFNTFFRYEYGGQAMASALYTKVENISENDLYYNLDKRALYDRWQSPGQNASYKKIDLTDSTPMSSRFILDDNVLSCESISVGWDCNDKWLQKIFVKGMTVRVYANNIFRLSSIKDERGIDYPYSNSVSMSLSLRL